MSLAVMVPSVVYDLATLLSMLLRQWAQGGINGATSESWEQCANISRLFMVMDMVGLSSMHSLACKEGSRLSHQTNGVPSGVIKASPRPMPEVLGAPNQEGGWGMISWK
eukprot:9237959-Ditylum_brightwellii.AAC.1